MGRLRVDPRCPGPAFPSLRTSPPRRSRRRVTSQQGKGARAPEHTFEEAKYLKRLIENGTRVRVRMQDGEDVSGTIEYYDHSFLRITREGAPNLFIFKHDIKYLVEEE
jgi:host factor-I protein